MTFILKDRVQETSTSTGTGNFTLDGANTNYQSFSSVCSTNDTFWYAIIHTGIAWETGIGTYSAVNTLTRTTVLESSNANALVNFGAGNKIVIMSLPASRARLIFFGANDLENIMAHNAVGDGVADDTAAWNAMIAAAVANGTKPYLPAGNYRIGPVNMTGLSDLTVEGDGAKSVLLADAGTGAVWMDISGSENLVFRNFTVERYSTQQPDILFQWMGTSTIDVDHLTFENVDVDAVSTYTHFYGYDFNGVTFKDCVWFQRYTGVSTTDPEKKTAVLHLTADNTNALNRTSAFVTVATGEKVAGQISMLGRCRFVAYPDGGGAGNAVSTILHTVQSLVAFNTKFYSMGICNLVIWDLCEGLHFIAPEFRDSSGAGGINTYAVILGGGLNSVMCFDGPFMTELTAGGAYFGIGPRIGTTPLLHGGVSQMIVRNVDIGGNANANPIIGLTKSYVAGDELSPWLNECWIDCSGNDIVTSGNIDNTTVLHDVDAVTTNGGTTDGNQFKSTGVIFPANVNNIGDASFANGAFTVAAGSGATGLTGTLTVGQVDLLTGFTSGSVSKANTLSAVGRYDTSFKSLQIVRKTVTETVTSSTTLQNDDVLSFAIAASETIYIELDLLVFGVAAGDIKLDVTAPSGCVPSVTYIGPQIGTTDVANTTFSLRSVAAGTAVAMGCDGISQELIQIKILAVNSTTAGNIVLQWAQNTSNATATEVRAGSFAKIWRL